MLPFDKGRNKVRPTIRLTLKGFEKLEAMCRQLHCNRNEMVESCINSVYRDLKDGRFNT